MNLFKILQDTTLADPPSSSATDAPASDNSTSDGNTTSSDDSTAPVVDWDGLRNNTDSCNQLVDEYWAQVQSLNQQVDENYDQTLNATELQDFFTRYGINADPVQQIALIDLDQDGQVQLSELCASALGAQLQDPNYAPTASSSFCPALGDQES